MMEQENTPKKSFTRREFLKRFHAAAAVTFEPGNYTAQLNVDILAVPESGAATIGRLQKSAQFKVFEIRQQGDSWYGKIAETADNWALLKDEKINYAIMTPQEGA